MCAVANLEAERAAVAAAAVPVNAAAPEIASAVIADSMTTAFTPAIGHIGVAAGIGSRLHDWFPHAASDASRLPAPTTTEDTPSEELSTGVSLWKKRRLNLPM